MFYNNLTLSMCLVNFCLFPYLFVAVPSLCGAGWPQICNLLYQPLKCLDFKCASPRIALKIFKMKAEGAHL